MLLRMTDERPTYVPPAFAALWSAKTQSRTGRREEVFVMQSAEDRIGTDCIGFRRGAAWTLQQLRETTGFERRYDYLLHDRDSIFAQHLDESVKKLAYDGAGNATGDGTRSFTYNNAGRMTSVTNGVVTTSYAFNALGERVKKSSPLSTTYFVYDEAGHLIGEYNAAGNIVEETAWMGDIPVATLQFGTSALKTYYVHTDHLNAPRRITNRNTNIIVWRWDSDPFGNGAAVQNPQGSITVAYNLRFPGQYYDQETGLFQNYFRDYDPATGRYVESDPIGLKDGVSTYGYVRQNPLLYSDPDGLLSQIVASCVCSYMKSSGYVAWQAWSAALGNRYKPGPWNDPVLRPCENYLYAYAAVVDYGDPAWFVDLGVFGHDFLKRIGRSRTSPPSDEARDAGYEGASDGAARKDWKKECQGGCGH